ncbi:hypothetical protein J2X20_003948 [Pelomonas saccharophila]|uniref:Uncharacterized protein n=1 Tax=Roseateles saccharophilus TaxID=304 RepID=A0ABU1YSQ8_ROSSA|nr:hypothetical protein [Roseateles saccharophilus]MDR7271280.1 hypothetical protein [Roseateles saccharophilus]
MPKLLSPAVGALLAACLALSAAAQPRPDPTDARAQVPRITAKKPPPPQAADDPPSADWRAANARVERIGGWRSYARETLAPEQAR